MPILDIQHRYRELGRIRLGAKATGTRKDGSTYEYPTSLETFRLTSPEKRYIERAAEIFGGAVDSWKSPRGQEWQVVTTTAQIPVMVPGQDLTNSQFYELWGIPEGEKGVRRLRRCDGQWESLTGAKCMCDPENRDCKPTSHLVVIIKDLPDIGVWRVTTHGINAAAELPVAIHTLGTAMAFGARIEAMLTTAPRSSIGADGTKRNYRVIEIRIPDMTPEQIVQSLPEGVNEAEFIAALTAGPEAGVPIGRPSLPPTPAAAALPAAPEPVSTPEDTEPPDGEIIETVGEIVENVADSWDPEPSTPQEDQPGLTVKERVVAEVSMLRDPSSQQDRLEQLLDTVPVQKDTMPVWEHFIRSVFALMAKLGYWSPNSLHAVLRQNFKAEHVGDLNKDQLVALGVRLADKARERVRG